MSALPPTVTRIVNFFYEIGGARRRPRNWEQAIGAPMANVAEHTYRVQMLAIYLALQEGADPKEAAFVALWHDGEEIRTGDLTPFQRVYGQMDGEKAFADSVAGTPLETLGNAAFKAYKARESVAAQCVKDADILDTVFELMELKASGNRYPLHPTSIEQIAMKREKYYTQTAKALHDAVTAEGAPSPWDWFLNGDSTFKRGTYGS
jgi:putative hydrolase of HD superfamily